MKVRGPLNFLNAETNAQDYQNRTNSDPLRHSFFNLKKAIYHRGHRGKLR